MIDTTLIEEGRRLDKREGNLRWEWGDWALKVAPMGGSHATTGTQDLVQDAVAAAGIESVALGTILNYRKVAAAWPDGLRRPSATWSVHAILLGHPGLIRDGMSVREAREITGQRAPEQNIIDSAPVTSERIRQAIAADPGLAREVVRDPQAASRLDAALDKQAEQDRRDHPTPVRRPNMYSAEVVMQSVMALSLDAAALLKDAEVLAGLSDDAKATVRKVLANVREALDTADAIMSGEDVQDTIDRILAEVE
jgi:hypothetical protein